MFKIKLKGFKKAADKFKKLEKKHAKAIWRKGVSAAATVVLKIARPLAPTESKTLRKSLGKRIKARKRDKVIVGVVGPRQRFQKYWKGQVRKPSKYAHLVEKGRKTRVRFSLRRGPYLIRGTKPKRFLGTAIKRGYSNALKAMADKMGQELDFIGKL